MLMIVHCTAHSGRFRTALKRLPRTTERRPKTSTCTALKSGNVQPFPTLLAMVGKRICIMGSRLRHCVECPKCCTRYLVGFSPYRNGSYLVPIALGYGEEWILYCACGMPPHSSRWNWDELQLYVVNNHAHHRGYGAPEEIVCISRNSRHSR